MERRIREAQASGEFDDLPGAGRPLELDDAALVPAELRMAYRLLKNAGYVPEEVMLRREIASLEQFAMQAERVEDCDRALDRAAALKRLSLLRSKLGGAAERSPMLDGDYREKLLSKLSGTD
ncbi:MAG: DnaJ family domain-containing protein [Gammaproteobacteria bacterium]